MPAETKESRNPELQKTTFLGKKKQQTPDQLFTISAEDGTCGNEITWQLKQLPEASHLPNIKLLIPFLPIPPNDSPPVFLNLANSPHCSSQKPSSHPWFLTFPHPSLSLYKHIQ